jgi:DNA repair protein RecN (Recombination protein N)
MLTALSIRDVVLIDKLDLAFHGGLNVFTGETGAGKSIILDALGLALGARGSVALVRGGAADDRPQSVVTATFEVAPDHPALALLRDNGLEVPAPDEPLILRRTLSADGRSRAYVNDQAIGIALLRQLGDALTEVIGHGEQLGLLDAAVHRAALDAFADTADERAAVAQAYDAWQSAIAEHDAATAVADRTQREEDELRAAVAELGKLDPQPDEEQELGRTRALLGNAGKVGESLAQALAEIGDGSGVGGRGIEDRIAAARRLLSRHTELGPPALKEALAALDRAAAEVAESVAQLERAAADLKADPRRLEAIEERLYALKSAARKYATDIAALPVLRAEFDRRLAALDQSGDALLALAQRVETARRAYLVAAATLSAARGDAAGRLDAAVAAELPPLRLAAARFRTVVEPASESAWGRDGADAVRFEIATNPDQPPGPLSRIASAGELSRFLLALRVVLSARQSAGTLVFDEVDSGIGGATAAAVGERLRRLGDRMQVLVVTHSPQVAARGHAYFRVQKSAGKARRDRTTTRVEDLAPDGRREEIARMLAGAKITDEARAAADRLMGALGA